MYIRVFIIRLTYSSILLVYVYAIYEHPSLQFRHRISETLSCHATIPSLRHGIEEEPIDLNFSIHSPLRSLVRNLFYAEEKVAIRLRYK